MACCSAHESQSDTFDQELELMAQDPTLASCCRRDLLDQAKHERLVAKLKSFDNTSARLKTYQGAVQSKADSLSRTETEGTPSKILAMSASILVN